jgi:putative intracellular protease/amidase
MNQRTVYVYVQDTWSDWEAGYVIVELNSGRFFKMKGDHLPVKTVGLTEAPITTAGGVRIVPDVTPSAVTADSSAMLILVGGETWNDPKHQPAVAKAKELLEANANVSAICGATGALAEAGLLDDRPHTSDALDFLKMVAPHYRGEAHYRDERAVSDGNLITASAAGSLQFARFILQRLAVFSDEVLEAWYNYFNTGEARYFFALMSALPK